ncbi:hypothetical protein CTRI78_v002893 [Colletotrichum trifolii]|uniref:Trichothecene 3-O-acetyltransferase n=1 Tax=Colletotrichum trifolii TaxID=5466 RepID=A0A4R8RLH6_COLTR|nr:hypothetical protein CTRI78_v002893 [Colletotrichum trifolii]
MTTKPQAESLPLSALDQIAPRIYVRLVFGFKIEEDFQTETAHMYLREQFSMLAMRYPFLLGHIKPTQSGRNELELTHPVINTNNLDPESYKALFDYQKISRLGPNGYDYSRLSNMGMPPFFMDKDVLSLSPTHPQAGEACPVFTLRITETIGGLFLCFSAHHSVCDGGFIKTLLEFFAEGYTTTAEDDVSERFDADYLMRPSLKDHEKVSVEWTDFDELAMSPDTELKTAATEEDSSLDSEMSSTTESASITGPSSASSSVAGPSVAGPSSAGPSSAGPSSAGPSSAGPSSASISVASSSVVGPYIDPYIRSASPVSCRIMRITNTRLECLYTQVMSHIRHKNLEQFVSKTDTLCAMTWVHVTQSRFPHLNITDKTTFTTAVDIRKQLNFNSSAWGNLYTQTAAHSTVGQLLQLTDTGELPTGHTELVASIADAAVLIRKAIERVKQPDYVSKRISLASKLEDPMEAGEMSKEMLQPDHAGLGCSVWTHMGGDVDFKIPGTTRGKADFVRKTYSANEGSMNILPRREVTKGNALWEILLTLRVEDMQRLIRSDGMAQWAKYYC